MSVYKKIMNQKLTCANHSEETIILEKVGFMVFLCPKCGSDYSIGRKILLEEMPEIRIGKSY